MTFHIEIPIKLLFKADPGDVHETGHTSIADFTTALAKFVSNVLEHGTIRDAFSEAIAGSETWADLVEWNGYAVEPTVALSSLLRRYTDWADDRDRVSADESEGKASSSDWWASDDTAVDLLRDFASYHDATNPPQHIAVYAAGILPLGVEGGDLTVYTDIDVAITSLGLNRYGPSAAALRAECLDTGRASCLAGGGDAPIVDAYLLELTHAGLVDHDLPDHDITDPQSLADALGGVWSFRR